MNHLRIVFFGSPAFAVPSLEALLRGGWPVAAVVTQPDRARGRGLTPSPGPVKAAAVAHGIPVLQPERLKTEDFLSDIARCAPDLGVVAAYGKILPQALLDIPRLGMVNVHASLLPRWRGASPVHRAVMAGDRETGVCIMRVVKELDAGGVFAGAPRPIGPDETSAEVERDLAVLGAELLAATLPVIAAGEALETPQDERGVSYAPRLTKEEGLIAWEADARAIHNQVRGLHPWPHAYTFLDNARVIVLQTALPASQNFAPPSSPRSTPPSSPWISAAAGLPPSPRPPLPGEVVAVEGERLVVAAGHGSILHLLRVQAEGRKPVTGRDFSAGARLEAGKRFGIWPA